MKYNPSIKDCIKMLDTLRRYAPSSYKTAAYTIWTHYQYGDYEIEPDVSNNPNDTREPGKTIRLDDYYRVERPKGR